MKTPVTKITTLLATAVLLLGFVQAAPAFAAMPGTISGHWVITQAAKYSQGVAPTAVACGTFTIAITSFSPLKAPSGTFSGAITTTTTYGSAGSITLPNGPVSGKWMTLPSGALLISFSGSNFLGSISSPNALPSPSINPATCPPLPSAGTGFLGLLHLPGLGTEGMTLYGTPTLQTQ
ncbi:MAG: hypothetical protein JRN39_07840 [Nitrososphaerota archaeon]|nr:hypothetical protein [Nitrososphaerota archaeon]